MQLYFMKRRNTRFHLTCYVERPYVNACSSIRLRYLTLNGVETSLTVNRCFDSVFCDATILLVTCEGSAWVAQHDIEKCNPLFLGDIHITPNGIITPVPTGNAV
jgi:hypothetical protein